MVLPLGDLEKTRIVPWATYTLIALNVVMYLFQLDRGDTFTVAYAATPYEISHNIDLTEPHVPGFPDNEHLHEIVNRGEPLPRVIDHAPVPIPVWLTMLTAMFLHANELHLAGNMLFLWIFGDNVEEVLGRARYIVVYLACGLVGTLLQVAASPDSMIPTLDSMIPTLGASGAIAGIMGAYVVWFPHNRVRVLVFRFVTQMPALLVVGGWIIAQIWLGFGSIRHMSENGGIAYLAHVGGAVTGILVALVFYNHAQYVHAMNQARSGWVEGPEELGPK